MNSKSITFGAIQLGDRGSYWWSDERKTWTAEKSKVKQSALNICAIYTSRNTKSNINLIAIDLQRRLNLDPNHNEHLNCEHLYRYLVAFKENGIVEAQDASRLLLNMLVMARHAGTDHQPPLSRPETLFSCLFGHGLTTTLSQFIKATPSAKSHSSVDLATVADAVIPRVRGLVYAYSSYVYNDRYEFKRAIKEVKQYLIDCHFSYYQVSHCCELLSSLNSEKKKVTQKIVQLLNSADAMLEQLVEAYSFTVSPTKLFALNLQASFKNNCFPAQSLFAIGFRLKLPLPDVSLPKNETAYFIKASRLFYQQKPNEALLVIKAAAEAGNKWAQTNLGDMYATGNFVDVDGAQAFKFYQEAIKEDCPAAYRGLAYCHSRGLGTPIDPKQAFANYTKAAEKGDVPSLVMLAYCYGNGSSVKQNYAKAKDLFEQAAKAGSALAYFELGRGFAKGWWGEVDLNWAVDYYRKAVAKGSIDALAQLGIAYLKGKGVINDPEIAAYYLSKAADFDHLRAMTTYANLLIDGEGVAKDWVKAYDYFQRAAQIDPTAASVLNGLGRCYEYGAGVAPNLELAITYYEQAKADSVDAVTNLGLLLDKKSTEQKDKELAWGYLFEGAIRGSAKAMVLVGHYLQNGIIAEPNLEYAFAWYHKAALKHDKQAYLKLGECYYAGIGTPKDLTKAIEYLKLAAACDCISATRLLAKINAREN